MKRVRPVESGLTMETAWLACSSSWTGRSRLTTWISPDGDCIHSEVSWLNNGR